MWNLGSEGTARKLALTMEEAHGECCDEELFEIMSPGASVSRVHFLHGEPILLSSAADNTLKVGPRQLI